MNARPGGDDGPTVSPAAVREKLLGLGFDEVRFAAIDGPLTSPLRAWLDAGMHADMDWLTRTVDKRLDPTLVVPEARSVVMLGVNYWADAFARPATGPVWARYALHEDYHDTIKPALLAAGKVLEELHGAAADSYRCYVDTGPVLERSWAARAGLGFTGKNAMLISRRHGNWLFLAAIVTRIAFTPDDPVRNRHHAGPVGALCGKCTRCLDACPTAAFTAPGVVDARRCVSYQTIENKGVIPRELRAGIGGRIYGCDTCLEVCPWNRFAAAGRQLLLAARHDLADLRLADILALTPERYAEVFRRTPIKRLKLTGLLRNACIVAGNSGDRTLLPLVLTLARTHASALVRAHAVWAVFRLGGGAELTADSTLERDPLVRAEYEAEAATGKAAVPPAGRSTAG